MKVVLLTAVLVLGFASPSLAASPDEAATDLSAEIMSPFCPGVTLHECPSAEALRLRDRIETWFRDGMSRNQILDRLEAEYGPGIRATPSPRGMGLVAWLVIAAIVVVALVTGALLVRRWSSRNDASSADPDALTSKERLRLDDELDRMRAGA